MEVNAIAVPAPGEPSAQSSAPPISPPAEKPPRSQRFVFLDGLRGIAALMVVVTHFYTMNILHPQLSRIVPTFIEYLVSTWFLGVPIFFVLSGFVIAYSQRGVQVTPRFLGNFALRRSLRLDPPYWIAIFLTALMNFVLRPVMEHPWPVPGVLNSLTNMFYLQGILRSPIIVGPSWTLCFEVQFYLSLTILVGISQYLPGAGKAMLGWRSATLIPLFVPLAIASIWVAIRGDQIAWMPAYWWMFFLGVLLWWRMNKLVSEAWLWLYMAVIAVTLCRGITGYNSVALLTGLAIYFASKTGGLMTWLRWRWVQFFGTISYSLYLTHDLFAPLAFLGKRVFPGSLWGAYLTIAVAFGLSVGFAYLMYRFVERTGIALGDRFKMRRGPVPVAELSLPANGG